MTNDASAGPRVSDEELARYSLAMRLFPRRTMHIGTLPDAPEYSNTFVKVLDMACDLADCRTALAAANARIAVLVAERDAAVVMRDTCGSTTDHPRSGYWSRTLKSTTDGVTITVTAEGVGKPLIELGDTWEVRLVPVAKRIATASPEPGAAHE